MRLVFVCALAILAAGCDLFSSGGTVVRVTVTADGEPLVGAGASLLARDPDNVFGSYLVGAASGRSRDDGRVTLIVIDDDEVPGSEHGYRLAVYPPIGVRCSERFFEPVEPGTDTRVTAAFTSCERVPAAAP